MTNRTGMKVGVVGVGAVGSAIASGLLARGVAREVVLVDRAMARSRAVALDMRYGTPLLPPVDLLAGGYDDLAGANLVIVTAGVNEAAGGATDRGDTAGRLRLLETNAAVYREVIPAVVAAAPQATIMVVTDPPDPLADLARVLAGHDRVFSTGTVLDSLRFRVHLGEHLCVCPADVEAMVVGEHGTTEVLLWSSASVAGVPALEILAAQDAPVDRIRSEIEDEIRYANINIIEGIGASQYGIGAVGARLAGGVLRDEQRIFTVAAYRSADLLTYSLPSVLGRDGVCQTHHPAMSEQEQDALVHSVQALRQACDRIR